MVFDFDGVLVDSNALKRRVFFEVFAAHAIAGPVVESGLEAAGDGDRQQVVRSVVTSAGLTGEDARRLSEACVAEYSRRCEEQIAVCPECDGAQRALVALSACGVPLYLNSATPGEALAAVVRRRGWSRFFAGLFGRPSLKTTILHHILDLEGIEPRALLFVGDRQSDYIAAVSVGCEFLGVRSDESDFETHVPLAPTLADVVDAVRRTRQTGAN